MRYYNALVSLIFVGRIIARDGFAWPSGGNLPMPSDKTVSKTLPTTTSSVLPEDPLTQNPASPTQQAPSSEQAAQVTALVSSNGLNDKTSTAVVTHVITVTPVTITSTPSVGFIGVESPTATTSPAPTDGGGISYMSPYPYPEHENSVVRRGATEVSNEDDKDKKYSKTWIQKYPAAFGSIVAVTFCVIVFASGVYHGWLTSRRAKKARAEEDVEAAAATA